ncbi:MAG TPA: DEAD/DEAH box helicase family protein [Pyrinomonadaceae bacterium]|nr:DEAD/DEAH box helicase family protein [Pyrinomonadaceae bacterium]
MSEKEATARIKINKLLEAAGWRLLDEETGRANVKLEPNIKIVERYGETFAKLKSGFADYLLYDEQNFPICVLEAKAPGIHPLVGKEQARTYAQNQNCRFVILSNGDLHYFWDLLLGNPRVITKFPELGEIRHFDEFRPTAKSLVGENIDKDYIVRTQKPDYSQDPNWKDESTRGEFIERNKLRFLRPYQLRAMNAIQKAVNEGKDRFLFEMATGTGKTLTSAAVIKLFLRSGNARRVLFLVDRLELEDQANRAFNEYIKNDFRSVIFKENPDGWNSAEIVVSTIQTLLAGNKYKRIFRPDDFQLVISDESHRSIGGNSRTVFEYFIGYKLGLTATPKDYLKKFDADDPNPKDPREMERRMLLDTYTTFGCENGEPTFRYSLIDGVNDGFLINPYVLDARTEITTQLLSDKGYSVSAVVVGTDGEAVEQDEETFFTRDFERRFFSDVTNRIVCKTFLDNALRDPITGEIGKTIAFAVSQNHAAKIVQILNEFADKMFPCKYNSDFAMQVTSSIQGAQQMTINFTNNNLGGTGNFDPVYKTSKTRVCVTVGMMTTGYDCPDILNLCMMRPIFSPTDFVQIKGRGTRKYNFAFDLIDEYRKKEFGNVEKQIFRLFDFFANYEYFEETFDYDEKLKLPKPRSIGDGENDGVDTGGGGVIDEYENFNPDPLKSLDEIEIGLEGMKIDRRLFEQFEEKVKTDEEIQKMVEGRDFEGIESYILENLFDKPEEFYNLDKIRRSLKIDRRLSLREIVEKIFGFIPKFKSKEELLEEEFDKFDSSFLPDEASFADAKDYFKSYLTDSKFREIIESGRFAELATNPNGAVFARLSTELRKAIPEYIKDNISLNRFME